MRIAMLCQSYPPMISGASLFAQSLAEGMAARGHSVLVIAASDTGKAYEDQRGTLTVHRVRSSENRLRAEQRMALFPFRAVRRSLNAFRPDVIHLHCVFPIALAGIAAGKRLGAPLLLTAHQLPGFVGTYFTAVPSAAPFIVRMLWGYTRFLDRHTHILAPTTAAAAEIDRQCGVRAGVIGYGLDLDHFKNTPLGAGEREALCRRYGLDPEKPVLLHVGRLDTDKKVHVVIKAAALALKRFDAQLLVVGDGQLRERLEELAIERGLAGRCRFTGFVRPEGDLPALYRAASAFIMASEIETQGLVVLEAMASGLPVVAVRATCIPDIVRDGWNGCLVEPGDSASMAERLVHLLEHPQKAAAMGQAGARIASQYSRTRSLDRYEAYYARLVEENRRAGSPATATMRPVNGDDAHPRSRRGAPPWASR